ncbi:hypothetical protein ACFL08_05275 [Patescibacteria group bacterium]
MNEFLKKYLLLSSIIVIYSLFAFTASAASEIDVEYASGININQNELFKASNIYPGWSNSETIRVTNKSELDSTNIYFNFDTKGRSKLSKKLKLYVVRISDKNYRIGGEGDRKNLKEADDKNLYVDKLEPGESKKYKIKIVFDKDADNSYQGTSFKFNIDFSMESKNDSGATEQDILAHQGRETFTGQSPQDSSEDGTQTENDDSDEALVAGAHSENNDQEVIGASDCVSWPLRNWFLLLITYIAIFSFNSFYKIKNDKNKIRWFWQFIYTCLAILVWYLFDGCKTFQWFPIAIIIAGAANYEIYLTLVKNNIKD